MTLSDRITGKVSTLYRLEPAEADAIVNLILEEMAEAVAAGDEISIPGVGTLRTETVPERRDYHPSTGAAMTTPASARVVFKPASQRQ